MHVKMTRIESGVTVPKGLFTLYMNVKIVTATIFWPPWYLTGKVYTECPKKEDESITPLFIGRF
jgi:hypothetical protein